MQLVSKVSNVCDPDPPNVTDGRTDRADRQTDDMQSTAFCTIVHSAVINQYRSIIIYTNCPF